MPRKDGIEATAEILARTPAERAPKIIVLTTFDLDEYVVAAIRAGASGFLLKDAQPEDLLGAIRTVHRGDAVIAPSATRRLLERVVSAPDPQEKDTSVLAPLTEREREVLTLMGRGFSNREIGAELFVAEATVKTPRGPGARQGRCPGPRPGRDHRLRDGAGRRRHGMTAAAGVRPRYDSGTTVERCVGRSARPQGDDVPDGEGGGSTMTAPLHAKEPDDRLIPSRSPVPRAR